MLDFVNPFSAFIDRAAISSLPKAAILVEFSVARCLSLMAAHCSGNKLGSCVTVNVENVAAGIAEINAGVN